MFNRTTGRTGRIITAAAITLGALITTVTPASAHVSAQMYGEKPFAGKYGAVFMRVPHAEPGKSMVKLEIQIPEGVTSVKPQRIPGWNESVTMTADGKNVATVIWDGGNLPDTSFQDFGLQVKFPATPGATLYFKAVQTLNDGTQSAWIEIPVAGAAAPSKPSPSIMLLDPAATTDTTAMTAAIKAATDAANAALDAAKAARWTGELTAKASLTAKTVKFVGDAAATHAGKVYVINVITDGKSKVVVSGRLDSRGDVFKTVAMVRAGKLGYQLKVGDTVELSVSGKTIATAIVG